jgi:CHAD domain-containing protein
MAFQLKPDEPASAGITRNVKSQIEKALKYLKANVDGQHGALENETVGEIRKCFKRVRAALRLVREELGDECYHEENWCFRDAARPLTEVRDAHILVETADRLRRHFPSDLEPAVFEKIREPLVNHQGEVSRRVIERDKALAAVKEVATRALARLANWKLQHEDWSVLETGMRHVYRTGRRAFLRAFENPSVENLHELRKQAKYLWHALQLVEAPLSGVEKELMRATHELSTMLGEDHDLAVLRQTLAADPLRYGGQRALKGVIAAIDRYRQELEHQAISSARRIYEDPPKVFVTRIAAAMHAEAVK